MLQTLRRTSPLTRRTRRVQRKQRSEHSFWWKPSTAQEIPNTGSIARDILATERTFLAWARTGLGFVGAGSALGAAYHREHAALAPTVLPASLLLIGNGAYLLLFATRRYWTVVAALQRDMFPIHTTGTLWAVVVTALNTVASLAIVARAEYMASAQDDGGNDVSTAQSEAKK